MGRVIAVFNQKGGVGKTTTNVNLAAYLASFGKKVLVIDIDPQGNSTSGLGIDKVTLTRSLYDLLVEGDLFEEVVIRDVFPGLDVLPSSVELSGAEIELIDMEKREFKLKFGIASHRDQYDYVFIDCPPSLGLLTINAITAADSVIIPIQCEYYALEGVSQLVNTFQLIKNHLNPHLEIEGVLMSMFDARTNLSIQVVEEVKKYFKDQVFQTMIPRNVRLAEAPSYGTPILHYDEKSRGATAYRDLAVEMLEMRGETIG